LNKPRGGTGGGPEYLGKKSALKRGGGDLLRGRTAAKKVLFRGEGNQTAGAGGGGRGTPGGKRK